MFRNSLRRISGHMHDRDAALRRGGQVHIVVACAAHQKQLHAAALQNAHCHGSGIGIDKCTHSFTVRHIRCRLRIQFRRPVLQFQIRILTDDRVKGFFVVSLCIKKCNLHLSTSFILSRPSGRLLIELLYILHGTISSGTSPLHLLQLRDRERDRQQEGQYVRDRL